MAGVAVVGGVAGGAGGAGVAGGTGGTGVAVVTGVAKVAVVAGVSCETEVAKVAGVAGGTGVAGGAEGAGGAGVAGGAKGAGGAGYIWHNNKVKKVISYKEKGNKGTLPLNMPAWNTLSSYSPSSLRGVKKNSNFLTSWGNQKTGILYSPTLYNPIIWKYK